MSMAIRHARPLRTLVVLVMLLAAGLAGILPAVTAQEGGAGGPFFGDGNRPPGCTTSFQTVSVGNGLTAPRFLDDCYHMRIDLNNLDSAKIDVLIVPPVSPYPERDLRAMYQSIEMWRDGIDYLAPKLGLNWLKSGVEFHIFIGHPGDDPDLEPLWFPKIVVVSTNPVGGAGIGVDPLDFIFGTSGPCHGMPNPLASFSDWERLPGFDNHHGYLSGTFATECENGGSLCFAVNGAIDPVPGAQNPIFGLYDLVSHEVGHCLSVGHVGDALDHRAVRVPVADIMSYTSQSFRKCVSTLDVEGFAVRMSQFLLPTPLVSNHATGQPSGVFQIQHRDDHYYASTTGAASDCPQPDLGLVPGPRVDFHPGRTTDPDPDNPSVRILSPTQGALVDAGITPVAGQVWRDSGVDPGELVATLNGAQAVAKGAAARYTLEASGGQSADGYTCEITATGAHTLDPVAGSDGCAVDITWSEAGTFTVTGEADDGDATASASLQVGVTDSNGVPDPDGSIRGGITIFPTGSPLAYNEALALATAEAGDPAPKFLPGTNVQLNTRFTLDETCVAGPTAPGQAAIVGLPFTWHIWTSGGELFDTVPCTTIQDSSPTTGINGFNCVGTYQIPERLGRYFTTLQSDNDGRWSCHSGSAIFGVVPPQGIPPCLKAFDVLVRDNVVPEVEGRRDERRGALHAHRIRRRIGKRVHVRDHGDRRAHAPSGRGHKRLRGGHHMERGRRAHGDGRR
jgi:hypothetical protein